ncbi:MAG: phosphoribosyltransferase [Proteobacteria bacterium]|nr:phosphoribosyltransferase [Pseudomonadota bacterium]MBU1140461.1 phosphoribosyltransferase [Pseudomonadota bacterium]MBU1419895.1 phosphoribosyltransferase [Pseudomonadota bacterium]MBU1454019.1 phosphoribosyltransferase [Pseudomonadota bacterium]
MVKQFQCELVSWSEVYRLSALLAQQVKDAGYKPDLVIAIARGGYIPARLLCDILDIYDLTSVRISHYTAGSNKEETARLSSPLCMELTGLKVLLVDDLTDTGDTIKVALQHIREFNPAEIRVAVLQHKKQSMLLPDFYAKKLVKWRWIIYPWAMVEDIGGFLRSMPELPATVEAARTILQADHGVKVPHRTLSRVFRIIERNG